MSVDQSNLSSIKYGYDFVVATTQSSINSTMKEFLSGGTEPEVTICYVADNQGNPTPIDYETLKSNAKGSDPFSVPGNANTQTNQDLNNLFAARFMVGFKARIGLPPGYQPVNIPDVVTLGSDTSAVSYNLMCSEFIVVEYTPGGGYSPASWMNQSQPPGKAWLFTSKVDLRLEPYGDAYSKLPPAVQAQIKNLGGNAFSVQQLLFDLDSAALQSIPTISGVDPGSNLYLCLQKDFVGKYFSTLKQSGVPVLGCTVTQSVTPKSTLTLTNLNFQTSPLLGTNNQPIANPTPDQQAAFTLNYLCSANGDALPAPTQFAWNWVDATNSGFDGAIAINRNTFRQYFANQLSSLVPNNCYLAWVQVTLDKASQPVYSHKLTPGQTPAVTSPPTGATVLSYSYNSSSSDQAGLDGDIGQLKISPSFTLDVSFENNTITITQHLVVYLYIKHLATPASGNIVDKTITDTYSLAVDEYGRLTAVLKSTTQDKSQTPGVNGFLNFFTNLNQLVNDQATWARACTSTNLTDIPVSALQNFVFPGGKTFVFKDASFSNYQDLVAHITYADPS